MLSWQCNTRWCMHTYNFCMLYMDTHTYTSCVWHQQATDDGERSLRVAVCPLSLKFPQGEYLLSHSHIGYMYLGKMLATLFRAHCCEDYISYTHTLSKLVCLGLSWRGHPPMVYKYPQCNEDVPLCRHSHLQGVSPTHCLGTLYRDPRHPGHQWGTYCVTV